jgi:phosphoglycolate phosphatase-like HAD superfamily hydrolase
VDGGKLPDMVQSPETPVRPQLLVLWDVDHTLIETRGVGRAIYDRAFMAAVGKPLTRLAHISGRTELEIMAESLRINGIEPTKEVVTRLANALVQGYKDERDELHTIGRPLPGAAETLAALAAQPAIYQSVLTGNLRAVARIKLEVFGLDQYLDLTAGAYGNDDPTRSKLVRIAQSRANERVGVAFGGDATVVVGDTPKDVEAGLVAGVHVIGVATGKTEADELSRAGAQDVAADLGECRMIVERLVTQLTHAEYP